MGAKGLNVPSILEETHVVNKFFRIFVDCIGTMVFLSFRSCPSTAPHWFVDVTSYGSLV